MLCICRKTCQTTARFFSGPCARVSCRNHAKFHAKSHHFFKFRSQNCANFGAERARTTRHTHPETINSHDVPCSICLGLLICFLQRCACVARKICVKFSPKLARFAPISAALRVIFAAKRAPETSLTFANTLQLAPRLPHGRAIF